MTISEHKIYPRTGDKETVYLKNVITNPNIIVGDFTMYNDFVNDPCQFEKNNVRYHYPINQDKLIIGKFCSIACGVKFLFNSANHTQSSLSTYPFPIFFEEWEMVQLSALVQLLRKMYPLTQLWVVYRRNPFERDFQRNRFLFYWN